MIIAAHPKTIPKRSFKGQLAPNQELSFSQCRAFNRKSFNELSPTYKCAEFGILSTKSKNIFKEESG
jgi:hypothetical protein